MQDITPIIDKRIKVIESYGAGGFTVSGEKIDSSIFLFQDFVKQVSANSIDDLSFNDFNNLSDIDILIICTGEKSNFLDSDLEKNLKSKNVKIEYMNSGAAARTYNVLVSEERKVAGLIIAV